jgi:hypothetical protein
MTWRETAWCLVLVLLSYVAAVMIAAAFMMVVACGGKGGTMCPKPRLADSSGSSPGPSCEVRK